MCYTRLMSESEQMPVGVIVEATIPFAAPNLRPEERLNAANLPGSAGLFGEKSLFCLLT